MNYGRRLCFMVVMFVCGGIFFGCTAGPDNVVDFKASDAAFKRALQAANANDAQTVESFFYHGQGITSENIKRATEDFTERFKGANASLIEKESRRTSKDIIDLFYDVTLSDGTKTIYGFILKKDGNEWKMTNLREMRRK